jgi:hypothetical protein
MDHPSCPALRLKKEYSYTFTPLWVLMAYFKANFITSFSIGDIT